MANAAITALWDTRTAISTSYTSTGGFDAIYGPDPMNTSLDDLSKLLVNMMENTNWSKPRDVNQLGIMTTIHSNALTACSNIIKSVNEATKACARNIS